MTDYKRPKTGGRQAGTPNKITRTVRQRFEETFEKLQNDDKAKLDTWAKANQTEFYKLAAKLIPVDMAVQGAITLNVVTGVPVLTGDDEIEDVTPSLGHEDLC